MNRIICVLAGLVLAIVAAVATGQAQAQSDGRSTQTATTLFARPTTASGRGSARVWE